ncbi:unnamed protein product, partial [Rotaria sp. Silwood1]
MARPLDEVAHPSDDTIQPLGDTADLPNSTIQSPNDMTIPVDDTVRLPDDMTQPLDDTAYLSDDTIQSSNDITYPSDYTPLSPTQLSTWIIVYGLFANLPHVALLSYSNAEFGTRLLFDLYHKYPETETKEPEFLPKPQQITPSSDVNSSD